MKYLHNKKIKRCVFVNDWQYKYTIYKTSRFEIKVEEITTSVERLNDNFTKLPATSGSSDTAQINGGRRWSPIASIT